MRYHAASENFFIAAFSGIDKARAPGERSFSKNLTDAVLRYDRRTDRWYEVDRHAFQAGGTYPHHDVRYHEPPHGWLNGPDNLLVVGDWLYAVAKDNNCLVRYDLRPIIEDPDAGPPPSEFILGKTIELRGHGGAICYGHSALATHDGWLYLGFRTTSQIVRFKLADDGRLEGESQRDGDGDPRLIGELVARLMPYDPETGQSANITDLAFDAEGRLYVVSAKPARLYRFTPDPERVFDARDPSAEDAPDPWFDAAAYTGNPNMKSENVLVDPDGRVYLTAGDAYGHYDETLAGTVYRITER